MRDTQLLYQIFVSDLQHSESRQNQEEQNIQVIAQSNGGRRRNQTAKKTVQKCIFPDILLPRHLSNGTDIENPYGDNVHDMDENNILEYRADPTVKGGVIAVG